MSVVSVFTPEPPDVHYAVGGLAMAATLAVRDLERRDPQQAKRTLTEALKDAKPHLSDELRTILERTR